MRTERRTSLRYRITLGAVLVLSLAFAVAALATSALLRRSLERDQATILDNRVAAVEQSIVDGTLRPVLDAVGRDVGQIQVVTADGHVLARTPGLATTTRLSVIAAPPAGTEVSATVDGGVIDGEPGEQYHVVARTVAGAGGRATIYGVTSLDAAGRAERYLRNGLLFALPVLAAITALGIFVLVGRALAPVERMRAEVDRIEAQDLSGRLRVTERDGELSHLGTTLNRMLARLEDDAKRQQLFGAAASHELRSPLSAIRTELEVGLAYPDHADWPAIAADSLVEIERLERLARDLRALTQPPATVDPADTVDVGAVVADEVARRVAPSGVTYRCQTCTAPVRISGERLVQAIRNLLDNAERHARSTVTVAMRRATQTVTLVVANDGEPIPETERERIFEPFYRLDEARSLDEGGSGLGLAISRSALMHAGGSLDADQVIDGASFTVRLPLADR